MGISQDLAHVYSPASRQYTKISKYQISNWYAYAAWLQANKKYEASLIEINPLIHFLESLHADTKLADVYILEGINHFYLGNYVKAIESILQAANYYETMDDDYGLMLSYNNIAGVLEILGDQEKSLEYFQKIWPLLENSNYEHFKATVLFNFSNTYVDLNRYEDALRYGYKALEKARELGLTELEIGCFYNMADAHYRNNRLELALASLDSAHLLLQNNDHHERFIQVHRMYGAVYNKMNRHALAFFHLDKALQKIANKPSRDNMRRLAPHLTEYFEATGNYKKAYYYDRLQLTIEKMKVWDKTDELASGIYAEFDLKRKEQENQALKVKRIRQEQLLKLNRKKNLFFIASGTLLLLFLTAIILGTRRRRKQLSIVKEQNLLLKQANARLEENMKKLRKENEVLNTYLSVVAHDLINPFQSLLGFTHMLASDVENLQWKEVQDYTQTIHNSAVNLNNLLENLLEWSQLQSGSIRSAPEKVPVYNQLKDVISLYQIVVQRKNIQVNIRMDKDTTVYCDPRALHTILRNIFGNALKYSFNDSPITIAAKEKNGTIIISVMDSGKGMSDERKKHLLTGEQFLPESGTSNEPGTGLGLLICKELTEVNGGELWFESGKGKGTVFYFSLPKDKDGHV